MHVSNVGGSGSSPKKLCYLTWL